MRARACVCVFVCVGGGWGVKHSAIYTHAHAYANVSKSQMHNYKHEPAYMHTAASDCITMMMTSLIYILGKWAIIYV